ncbi:MAG: hypothetical protein KGM42_06140 [Hyphomicrobiales bacterium]|nr:hypothetical protein [Hyphomicrobiales bacterium]
MRPARFSLARSAIAFVAAAAVVAVVAAADSQAAPKPPQRPSPAARRAPAKPAPAKPAPAKPAPPKAPAGAPATGNATQDPRTLPPIDPDHPPVLPDASRERMRDCGREWEAMKMAGKDEGGWRAFATRCLTR